MSDDSLEKHIQLDGPDQSISKPSPMFGNRSGDDNGGGNNGDGGGTVPPSTLPVGPVKQFYRDLLMVLTEPRLFFEIRYPDTSFTYALAFGIIVNWIAVFLSWLTRIIRHETLFDGFLKMRDQLQGLPYWKNLPDNFWAQSNPVPAAMFPAWLLELFRIIVSPFQSLIGLIFYGVVILVGCYLLIPKDSNRDSIELKNTVRIVSFASAPVLVSAILGFLPLGLGTFLGGVYAFILLIYALALRFRVSNLRAFGVVIFPVVISGFVFSCMIGIFGVLFFGVIASLLGGFHP